MLMVAYGLLIKEQKIGILGLVTWVKIA